MFFDLSSIPFVRDLARIEPGTPFTTVAIINRCQSTSSPRSGEMLRVEFSDKTATVGCVLFSSHPQYSDLKAGAPEGPCLIRGEAAVYQGAFSPRLISIDKIGEAQAEECISRVVRCSPIPVDELKRRFETLIGLIENQTVVQAIRSILAMPDIGELFFTSPAASQVHHAYRHGLVEHTCSVAEMAVAALRHYDRMHLRKDVVLAGIIIHDVGKVVEYTQTGLAKTTIKGLLSSHITEGHLRWCIAARACGVPVDLRDAIAHVILSHHGELEYGSPVVPHIPEAWLVHKLDCLDATMASIEGAFASEPDVAITSRKHYLPEIISQEALTSDAYNTAEISR